MRPPGSDPEHTAGLVIWLRVGAAVLLLTVAAGAFGAHVLEGRLTGRALSTFETAVRYSAWHGLGLLAIGLVGETGVAGSGTGLAGGLMTAGGLLFGGSLVGLALGGPSWLGAVTPVGGLCLLAAWGALLFALFGGR